MSVESENESVVALDAHKYCERNPRLASLFYVGQSMVVVASAANLLDKWDQSISSRLKNTGISLLMSSRELLLVVATWKENTSTTCKLQYSRLQVIYRFIVNVLSYILIRIVYTVSECVLTYVNIINGLVIHTL